MPIRTQFDTGVYGNFNTGRTSLADVVGAVRGIQSIANTARTTRREEDLYQELKEDDRYLNDVYARNFAGWNGTDKADFQRRNQAANMEIQKARPKLFSKAYGMSKTLEDAMNQRITSDKDIDTKIKENEAAGLDLATKRAALQNGLLDRTRADINTIGQVFYGVKKGDITFDDAVAQLKAWGIKANLPTKQQFEANPNQYYNYLVENKLKNDEAIQANARRMEELGIKLKEKEVNWYDGLKQAEINQKNRTGTGGSSNIDTTGLTDIDMTNARKLAREIAGVRGSERILPSIVRYMKAGNTIDQIRDEMRYSQQSENFSGPAREVMQNIYAGKGGKSVDAQFDYFDDLLDKGDPKAISNFLKTSAIKSVGTSEAAQVRGTERTLNFINEIETDLDNYEQRGGDTNIFSGTAENFRKKLGYVKDPEMRKIAEKIHAAIMKYRRSMSGAAFSVPESAEYESLFPSTTKTGALNTAVIDALKETFSGDLKNFYTITMGENGYNTFIAGASSNTENDPLGIR